MKRNTVQKVESQVNPISVGTLLELARVISRKDSISIEHYKRTKQ